MLESARRNIATLPKVPAQVLLSAGTMVSFAWLLANNRIHPILVYVLQIYLTF